MTPDPKSNVVKLYPDPLTVDEALGVAKDCESVIVIGFLEDQTLHLSFSGKPNIYEVIGLLARAQQTLIEVTRGE